MFQNDPTDEVSPLPEMPLKAPQLGDIFKMASSIMGGNGNDLPSPLAFINTPEFSQTVESMTRGLLESLTNGGGFPQVNRKKSNKTENDEKNKTKDLVLELPVSLEDLYRGKNKKVTVKRKRSYEQSDGTFKIVEERHKLLIEIKKGSRNDQRIVFPNEADELPGFESGDVIIILKEQEHPVFIRCFDDLMVNRNISISELFYFDTCLTLLDGTSIRIKNTQNDLLSESGYIRKITGKGMPIPNNPTKYGDLFVQFNVVPQCDVVPSKEDLCALFPPLNVLSKEDESKEVIELDILADDDFYKLDLFEEDECDEGEDLGDDDTSGDDNDDDDDTSVDEDDEECENQLKKDDIDEDEEDEDEEEEEEEAEEEEYEDEEEADKGRTDEFEISLTNGYKVAETLDIDDCTTGST